MCGQHTHTLLSSVCRCECLVSPLISTIFRIRSLATCQTNSLTCAEYPPPPPHPLSQTQVVWTWVRPDHRGQQCTSLTHTLFVFPRSFLHSPSQDAIWSSSIKPRPSLIHHQLILRYSDYWCSFICLRPAQSPSHLPGPYQQNDQ